MFIGLFASAKMVYTALGLAYYSFHDLPLAGLFASRCKNRPLLLRLRNDFHFVFTSFRVDRFSSIVCECIPLLERRFI